jgi:hypothetical protein
MTRADTVSRPRRAVKGMSAAATKSSTARSADMATAAMKSSDVGASTMETSAAVETTTAMTSSAAMTAATMSSTATGGVGEICRGPDHRCGQDRQQRPTKLASFQHFFLPEDGSAQNDSTRRT